MKLLIIFVFGLAITVPTTHGQGGIDNVLEARRRMLIYQPRLKLEDEKGNFTSCGGSLISPNYILTAAHCLKNKVNATVYLGIITRKGGKAFRNVSRSDFIVHDGYNSRTRKNDIALIKIPTVKLTRNIQMVKFPKITEKQQFRNRTVLITRWNKKRKGTSDFHARSQQVMQLKVLSNTNCQKRFELNNYIKKRDLCAYTPKLHACAGDDGGPVVLEYTNQQVAIVSRSYEGDYVLWVPCVFVRITEFLQWIKDNSDVKL